MLIENGKTNCNCLCKTFPSNHARSEAVYLCHTTSTNKSCHSNSHERTMSGDCILTWTNHSCCCFLKGHSVTDMDCWMVPYSKQSETRLQCAAYHTEVYWPATCINTHLHFQAGKQLALSLLKHLVTNSKVIKVRVSHFTHVSLQLKYPISELPVIWVSLISYNFHGSTGRPPSSSFMPPLLSQKKKEKQSDGCGKSYYKNKYVYFQFISPHIHVCAPHRPWNLFQLPLQLTI